MKRTLRVATVLGVFTVVAYLSAQPPRTIAVGASADLCLLTRPLGAALHHAVDAATAAVAATFVAGRIVHSIPSVTEGT